MTIRQHTCYVAVCDECKNDYENGEYTPYFDSPGEAMDEAGSSDWVQLADGAVFCNRCIPVLVARGVIEEDDDVSGPAYRRVTAASLPAAEDGE